MFSWVYVDPWINNNVRNLKALNRDSMMLTLQQKIQMQAFYSIEKLADLFKVNHDTQRNEIEEHKQQKMRLNIDYNEKSSFFCAKIRLLPIILTYLEQKY